MVSIWKENCYLDLEITDGGYLATCLNNQELFFSFKSDSSAFSISVFLHFCGFIQLKFFPMFTFSKL